MKKKKAHRVLRHTFIKDNLYYFSCIVQIIFGVVFSFKRNLIRRLSLLGINQISIDLSGGDILMR